MSIFARRRVCVRGRKRKNETERVRERGEIEGREGRLNDRV